MIAPPIETSAGERTVCTASWGDWIPRPIAKPRKARSKVGLIALASRSMVVRRPDAMGARIEVANMEAMSDQSMC